MTTYKLYWSLVAFLLVGSRSLGAPAFAPGGIAIGYVDGTSVYTVGARKTGDVDSFGDTAISFGVYRYDLTRKRLPRYSLFEIDEGTMGRRFLYPWRIAHGCYWTAGQLDNSGSSSLRIPLEELSTFDPKDREGIKVRELIYKNKPGFYYDWESPPLSDILYEYKAVEVGLGSIVPGIVFRDYVPTGPTSSLGFALAGGKMMVFSGRGKWIENEARWEVTSSKKELIDANFHEPFLTLISGADYYFLTQSGKLYVAKKPKEGWRKTERVWPYGLGHGPVNGVVGHVDSGKVYLFGKGSAEKGSFFFELGEKPTPIYYHAQDVKPVQVPEPLKRVIGYAEVLIAEKRIQLK